MLIGIFFAMMVGLSWIVTGAAVGLAEKHGYGAWRHQFVYTSMYGVAAAIVLAVGATLRPDAPAFSLRFNPLPALCVVLWGVLSYAQNLCVGVGMRNGPNGIVWTIVQSGFVFPVVLGFATGNTPLTGLKAAGVVCVLLGIVCCGRARGSDAAPFRRGWLLPALLGFFFCGLNQCAQALASFFPAGTRPTPLVRVICGAIGVIMAVAVHRAVVRFCRSVHVGEHPAPQGKCGFLLKICAVNAVFFFLAGFCFHYNALDRLEAAGRISAANPIMLASCLLGFAIYGTVALKERLTLTQLGGTALAVAGAAFIAA